MSLFFNFKRISKVVFSASMMKTDSFFSHQIFEANLDQTADCSIKQPLKTVILVKKVFRKDVIILIFQRNKLSPKNKSS